MEKILTNGTAFVDEYGRERIFNGVNLVNKGHYNNETGKTEYYNVDWDEDMFRKLSEQGINLIRFGLVWNAGIQILIFLAALQNIPTSAKEAAQMEGATAWEYFWKITFPMIKKVFLMVKQKLRYSANTQYATMQTAEME